MKIFTRVLKLFSVIFVAVGILHLVLGLGADVLLGANVPEVVLTDPVLDSQNRFYGIAFTLYGILFYLCATDLERYAVVLHCVLAVFFAAGLARLVSVAVVGWPSVLVVNLLVSELLLPPIVAVWFSRLRQAQISIH